MRRDISRKYVNEVERSRFLALLKEKDEKTKLFSMVMCETGARISECLSITPSSLNFIENYIMIESLKKRRRGRYRQVPISADLHEMLSRYAEREAIGEFERIWGWSRMTAYRRVKEIMVEARVDVGVAHPKALRHGFAIAALTRGIPVTLVQRWLGHADIETTAIYTNFVGIEELEFASRLWHEMI